MSNAINWLNNLPDQISTLRTRLQENRGILNNIYNIQHAWIPDTIANISSAEDFVRAAAGSPEWLLSFTAKQWLRAWIKKMNDPDTYIKSLFTDVDKIVNTTPNVYNLVQEWMLR